MSIGVDPKCFELSEHFLAGEDHDSLENREALAEILQQAAEDFLYQLSALKVVDEARKNDEE
jgi:hypothetical protein